MTQVPQFRDVVFEQECGAVLSHILALEYIWRISDLDLIGSEGDSIEDIMDILDGGGKTSSDENLSSEFDQDGGDSEKVKRKPPTHMGDET